jgi:hypothetical protein
MAGGAPYPLPAAAAGGGCATVVDAVGVNCVRGCTVCCICGQQDNAQDTQRTCSFPRYARHPVALQQQLIQQVRNGEKCNLHCGTRMVAGERQLRA